MTAPTLYGILDLARAPELYEHVARLEPGAAACLFEGRLAPQLKRVSPHLVELAAGDPMAAAWRGAGWGRSWGILLQSREGLAFVRRRLRHFTQARLPDGQGPVLFRFWDPRVFRVYLPLVETADLAAWFQGIDAFLCESEDGRQALRFALRGGALAVETDPPPVERQLSRT
ncbi:MAG TPA: DUF4123 domain-containing protein [Rhizomicrobium sp.]